MVAQVTLLEAQVPEALAISMVVREALMEPAVPVALEVVQALLRRAPVGLEGPAQLMLLLRVLMVMTVI